MVSQKYLVATQFLKVLSFSQNYFAWNHLTCAMHTQSGNVYQWDLEKARRLKPIDFGQCGYVKW